MDTKYVDILEDVNFLRPYLYNELASYLGSIKEPMSVSELHRTIKNVDERLRVVEKNARIIIEVDTYEGRYVHSGW